MGRILAIALLCAATSGALAQTGIRSASSTPSVRTQGVEGVDPAARPGTPPVRVPDEAPSPPPSDESAALTFRVNTIRFEGNTRLPAADLEELARSVQGKDVNLAALTQLRKRVRALYQSRGYVLARVTLPPQKAESGVITLQIFEGRYGKLTVSGNQFYSARFIERFFRPVLAEGVVRQKSVQRALLLLNEYPDLSAASVFTKGESVGTADLGVQVKDSEPLHAILEYNSYGTRRLGRSRAGLAIIANNVFADGDEVFGRATYLLPRTSDPFFQVSYAVPVGALGDKWSVSYANSAVVLGGDVAVLDIRGDADIFTLTFQRPFLRELDRSANWTAGFLVKSAENVIFGADLVSKDDLRLFTAGIDGQQARGNLRALYSATLTQGLGEVFGGVKSGARFADGALRASREGAGNEMTKANADVFLIRRMKAGDFLLLRAGGQVAGDPLPVIEQFGLGGPDSVRGYLQSEFLGDEGYTASLEYRYPLFSGKANHSQLVGFFDHGHARLQRPRAGEQASRTLNGAGAGMRLALGSHLSARLDLGFPLEGDNIEFTSPVIYGQMANRW